MSADRPTDRTTRVPRTGFSLIEVVLALLVFGLGILGVLALFPTGTSHNRDAQDYTYSAQFARRVFDGVLAKAMGNTNFWDQLSNHIAGGCATAMTVSDAPDNSNNDFFWLDPASFGIVCYTGVQTVVFRAQDDTNVLDHVLRYRLLGGNLEMPRNMDGIGAWIVNVVPGNFVITNADGTVTNELNTNWVTRWWIRESEWLSYDRRYRDKTLHLTLTVWPGRYGSRNVRTYYCYVPRFW